MYLQHKPALKSKGQLADDKGGILSQSGQLLPQIGDLLADGYDRNDRFHDPVGFLAGLYLVGGDVNTVQADRSGFPRNIAKNSLSVKPVILLPLSATQRYGQFVYMLR